MNALKTRIDPEPQTTAKHRLISFEPSHSWLKRCDERGPLVVQAGYRESPTGRIPKDNQNPLIELEGQRRWYGALACEGDHKSPLYSRKESEARAAFAACLQESDDCRDLTIVVSHHQEDTATAIARSLEGYYSVIRNGRTINCNVIRAIPETEGMGTYYLLKPQLKPTKTLLFELGFGSSEEWIIHPNGAIQGEATEVMAVSGLVAKIAADQTIRAHSLKLAEQQINLDLISKALRSGTYGSLPREHWEAIAQKYIESWYQGIKGYMLKRYGSELQTSPNIVFTGGGAALIADRVSKFATVPTDPQTASVRGLYGHYSKRLTGVTHGA